jgi:signal peptidase I
MNGRATSSRRRARTVAAATAAVLALVCIGIGGWWAVSGGRWFVVRTPSMGTAAPVGTLLWVEPTSAEQVHVGDVITFTPPGVHQTYSHRVYSIDQGGGFHTKGDANAGPDPWTLDGRDIVGKVVLHWMRVGWLVRAVPVLAVGALLLYALVRWATPSGRRLPATIVGISFLISLSLFVYRPLVAADKLAILPTNPGIQATYISTGLLPLRLHAEGGTSVDLHDGEQGTVRSTRGAAAGRLGVGLTPLISWWWWLLIIVPWFLPAMWTTLANRAARRDAVT